jgi:hypothetical protein
MGVNRISYNHQTVGVQSMHVSNTRHAHFDTTDSEFQHSIYQLILPHAAKVYVNVFQTVHDTLCEDIIKTIAFCMELYL